MGVQAVKGDGSPEPGDVAACLRVLRQLAQSPHLCDADGEVGLVREHAARLLHASKKHHGRVVQQRDRDLLDSSGLRAGKAASLPPRAADVQLARPRPCYVCKQPYTRAHPFYDSLCAACGEFNFAKRSQTADLSGRVAVVTGGRVKIGYQVGLKLLRAGAAVVAITRFPCDAARRYAAEPDFAAWGARLSLHAIDLRDLAAVDRLGQGLAGRLGRLDVLVNNAAQTVRRPPAFYRHLVEREHDDSLPGGARALLAPGDLDVSPARRTQLALLPGDDDASHFPAGRIDRFGQQVDLRPVNSWAQGLADVAPLELVEVHAVNCLAPFLLLRRLEPLFPAGGPCHVVNVAAAEGRFEGSRKWGRHPHTNMAKAALNMLTRTCAGPYAERGVYINSVDTGWASNEAPLPTTERMEARGAREPLDVVDCAARVLDPVFVGFATGRHEFGQLWKDYKPTSW